jgi:hypothetical protein
VALPALMWKLWWLWWSLSGVVNTSFGALVVEEQHMRDELAEEHWDILPSC